MAPHDNDTETLETCEGQDSLVKILVLSDLHFNANEKYNDDQALYETHHNCLNSLVNFLQASKAFFNINIIIITGDLGYSGKDADYQLASIWLKELIVATGVKENNVLVCAGNHDIDRERTLGVTYPPDEKRAGENLKIKNLHNYNQCFRAYSAFCKKLHLQPYLFGQSNQKIRKPSGKIEKFYKNFLIGCRSLEGLNFVALNSAWYSRDSILDNGRLWLGSDISTLCHLKGLLCKPSEKRISPIIITFFHHPKDWLQKNGHNDVSDDFTYVLKRSHFVLTGHVHKTQPCPDKLALEAYYLESGAVLHPKPNYENNCSIFQINKRNREFNWGLIKWDCNQSEWNFEGWNKENVKIDN